MKFQHPNICPTALMEFNESGAVVVRRYHVRGSLRDLMYSVKKPSGNYWNKYALRKGQRKFETADLRLIGYQILVGLSFLHSKSIAHGKLVEEELLLVIGLIIFFAFLKDTCILETCS